MSQSPPQIKVVIHGWTFHDQEIKIADFVDATLPMDDIERYCKALIDEVADGGLTHWSWHFESSDAAAGPV